MLFLKDKIAICCLAVALVACGSTPKKYGPVKVKDPALATEINQNVTYYCMLHESDGSFDSRDECRNYGKSVLHECNVSTGHVGNMSLLNCLKSRLKL